MKILPALHIYHLAIVYISADSRAGNVTWPDKKLLVQARWSGSYFEPYKYRLCKLCKQEKYHNKISQLGFD